MKEFWNERYSEETYAYGTNPNDFLKENIRLFAPQANILCLAEGEGRNAVFLAANGCNVSAVDQSDVGKVKALKLAEQQNVSIDYNIGDLGSYDMGQEKWDGIVSIWAHTPSSMRRYVFSAIKAGLKPGGIFLLEGYNIQQLEYKTGGPKEADMFFSLEELKEVFSGYEILHAANKIRDIEEGAYHAGASSVVQFVARRK